MHASDTSLVFGSCMRPPCDVSYESPFLSLVIIFYAFIYKYAESYLFCFVKNHTNPPTHYIHGSRSRNLKRGRGSCTWIQSTNTPHSSAFSLFMKIGVPTVNKKKKRGRGGGGVSPSSAPVPTTILGVSIHVKF